MKKVISIACVCTAALALCTACDASPATVSASSATVAFSPPSAAASSPTAEPAPEEATMVAQESEFEVEGLRLIWGDTPDGAELIDSLLMSDGTYRKSYMSDDGIVFTQERLAASYAAEQQEVLDLLMQCNPDAYDVSVERNDEISERLTYPSWSVEFKTGHNEDTRQCGGAYVTTDSWDFLVTYIIPIDWMEDYEGQPEQWLAGLILAE